MKVDRSYDHWKKAANDRETVGKTGIGVQRTTYHHSWCRLFSTAGKFRKGRGLWPVHQIWTINSFPPVLL